MKKFLIFLFLTAGIPLLFAKSADLAGIFPQNSSNLTEMSEDSGKTIVSGCRDIIDQSLKNLGAGKDFSYTRVFTQSSSGAKIYRIILTAVDFEKLDFPTLESGTYTENDFHWLQSKSHAVVQVIVKKDTPGYKLLGADITGLWKKDNSGTSIYFSDFLISTTEDSVRTMHLKAEIPVSIGTTWDGLTKTAFLTRGTSLFGKQSAEYTIEENGAKSTVKIKAADFLADRSAPLKYSLLAAFDGNPFTCYKENSSENVITIQISFQMDRTWIKNHGKIHITQASIINGDSRGRKDYFASDRIGAVTAEAWDTENAPSTKETLSFTLKDYSLESQGIYMPFTAGKNYYIFSTSEIIKGDNHDLSIGEFNLKSIGYGWIF